MIKSLDFRTSDLSFKNSYFKTIPDWVFIFIQTQFWKGLSLRRSNSSNPCLIHDTEENPTSSQESIIIIIIIIKIIM